MWTIIKRKSRNFKMNESISEIWIVWLVSWVDRRIVQNIFFYNYQRPQNAKIIHKLHHPNCPTIARSKLHKSTTFRASSLQFIQFISEHNSCKQVLNKSSISEKGQIKKFQFENVIVSISIKCDFSILCRNEKKCCRKWTYLTK